MLRKAAPKHSTPLGANARRPLKLDSCAITPSLLVAAPARAVRPAAVAQRPIPNVATPMNP
ncbi:MAG: hypothetical protein ACRD0K_07205 [Egibacteraceae bacterium]